MTNPIAVGYGPNGSDCKADNQNAQECPSEIRHQRLSGLPFVHSERAATFNAPRLSHSPREGARLQLDRDGRLRCSASLARMSPLPQQITAERTANQNPQ